MRESTMRVSGYDLRLKAHVVVDRRPSCCKYRSKARAIGDEVAAASTSTTPGCIAPGDGIASGPC